METVQSLRQHKLNNSLRNDSLALTTVSQNTFINLPHLLESTASYLNALLQNRLIVTYRY